MSNGYYIDEASGITARHGDNAIIADFYVKLVEPQADCLKYKKKNSAITKFLNNIWSG